MENMNYHDHDEPPPSSKNLFYDVFLSFRGEGGTRYGFTNNIYKALHQKGIFTFRDTERLKIGEDLRPTLTDAIEVSRMLIVVLCQNYASSTWCLDELAHIIHCYHNKGNQVFIIYYKVEPSDVWNVKNTFETAMTEHENRFGRESEKVKLWRNALSTVRELPKEHCKSEMFEPELIKKIVEDTVSKLPPVPAPMKDIVGLDSRFEMVKPLLNIESHCDTICMVEIYGAGGIGKTTFAMDIFNKIRRQFEAASFLANVREKSNRSTKGLEDLQRTLLTEMGEETEETKLGSTFSGSFEIKRKLGHKRVLLVLDDVDSPKQIEALTGGCDWFGSGSRIIITTRESTLLDSNYNFMDGVIIEKYKMEELNDRDSLELLCRRAFNMSKPAENFEDVSSLAVSYAKGVPLALKVIGSNLKGGSPRDWEIELEKYKKIPNAEIQGVLEISYISLSELDKKTFLDIACFFEGERWEYVERILKACDFAPSIRPFVAKCLLNIDENGCLDMHDLIQDMGKEIVRKESPLNLGDRSRLWSHKEVLHVLKENSGSSKIEGIMLDPPAHEEEKNWRDNAFKKMENLRILIIRNTTVSTVPSYLPNSLRVLDWKGYPSKSFPVDFYPKRIVDFKLPHSSLMLEKPLQIFEVLTFINLSQCQSITEIPDVSGAINLKVLTLDKCHKVVRFHESIGFLPKLVCLNASECTMLKSFVPRMYLPSLEVLSFNLCKRLEHFPDVTQKMDKPLKIWMIDTAIMRFPNSIGNLTRLEYIDISFCKRLSDLSYTFFLLPRFVTLRIDGCSQLGKSFKRFKESRSAENGYSNLVTLYLSYASLSDEDLHIILESCPKLEDLNVSHNKFGSLPKSIKGSLHLKSIDLSYCRNLMEIPELPLSIQKVDARYCRRLTSQASNVLWSKVCKEKERIQVVMPKAKIPNWFDCVGGEDIPLFWARRKFPVVALALLFGKSKQNSEIEKDTVSELFPGMMSGMSHVVGLHIFIEGQEVCRKNYHYCSVGEDHVLMCDLRALFTDEEWQDLDACVGDDWKVVQVQCESGLTLNCWGVCVFKQKTSIDDISFTLPNPNSSGGDFVPIPASSLVPKRSPQMSGQRMRRVSENMNPREIYGEFLPLQELQETPSFTKALLRSWMIANVDIEGEASATAYGGSLKQEHEESGWDVVRVVELVKDNIPEHINDLYSFDNNDIQSAQRVVEQVLRAREEFMKEQGSGRLECDMPIILEACHFGEPPSRRYWGKLEIEHGDPKFKAVLNKTAQLAWKILVRKEVPTYNMNIVLLKCQRPSTEEASSSSRVDLFDEDYYDPVLEELMIMIEEDATRFNKSYGKLKASIVLTNEEVSTKYASEALYLRAQEDLKKGDIKGTLKMEILKYSMSRSKFLELGRLKENFKKTPFGKLRVEGDDTKSTTQKQKESRMMYDVKQTVDNQKQMQPELRVEDGDTQKQNESRVMHDVQQTVHNQNQMQHELRVECDDTQKQNESRVMHEVQQTVLNQNQMQHDELRDPQPITPNKKKPDAFMSCIMCCCCCTSK